MTLQDFLALPIRHQWGGVGGEDCLTMLGRRTELRCGIDPIEAYRGTYSSAEGAMRIVARAGGMVSLVASVAEPFGFSRVAQGDSLDDDIAVVRAPSALTGRAAEIGAIRFGPLWIMIGDDGLKVTRAEPLTVWRLSL